MECVCLYKIFYSKENVSLQNGCAYTRGLYMSLLHARACPFVFFLFRAASQNRQSFGNTDTDDDNDDNDVHLCSMICKRVYTLRFPAFGLKSLQDGCALRMCCFCIVIQYCSIKITKY